MGIDPVTHRPRTDLNILPNLPQLLAAANFTNLIMTTIPSDAAHLAKLQLLHNVIQVLGTTPTMEALNFLAGPTFRENHQFSNLSLGFAPHELTQSQSNLLNSEAPQKHQPEVTEYHNQPMKDSNNHQFPASSSSPSLSPANIPPPLTQSQLPALVPASPDRRPQTENKNINQINISNPSSTSTTFEAWGDLMDDEESDSYWRDIIE